MSRQHGITHPESEQGVLKARCLTSIKHVSLTGVGRSKQVAETAEALRILYLDSGFLPEKVHRPLHIDPLPVKIGEKTGGNGPFALADQQVRISIWRQLIRHRSEGAVGLVGFKDIPGGNRVDALRAMCNNSSLREVASLLIEPNFHPCGEGLLLESLIEGVLIGTAANKVKEWLRRPADMFMTVRIIEHAFAKRCVLEGRADAEG